MNYNSEWLSSCLPLSFSSSSVLSYQFLGKV